MESLHHRVSEAQEALAGYPNATILWARIQELYLRARLREEQVGGGVPDTRPEEFYS